MPAYRHVKNQLKHINLAAQITVQGQKIELIESTLPGTHLPIWLIECPALFDREGGPYTRPIGETWPDNAQRFALFSRVITALAINQIGLNWQPDILHCNDWQTALAPALLQFEQSRPGIIFTIHNLAYQGVFPYATFIDLHLPNELWSYESMEFHDQFSFIKGGIIYADQVNTVSPTYAKEIQTEIYGSGLEKLLQYHNKKLTGIINGVNKNEWNPNDDKYIYTKFNSKTISNKIKNKLALQKELKLKIDNNIPLYATVSRLATQKGTDLILEVLSQLNSFNVQIVILGSGEKNLEKSLSHAAKQKPEQVFVKIGYDEKLAHKITASADFFLMPSRFEPCGLNQMYSQNYGTIPIARKTGGLTDTVIDEAINISNTTQNTGILFIKDDVDDLLKAMIRGLDIYASKSIYKRMQLNGMRQDFSWDKSAKEYIKLYYKAVASRK